MFRKEEIKTLVRQRLSNKRIILFGAGVIAETFYQEYKDRLRISHCVSNYSEEWGEGKLLGQLDVRPYKKEEIQPDDYIIVCGYIAFREIELQLMRDGMSMYEHFIESQIARAIFAEKKIILFYGTCILRDVFQCIIKVQDFCDRYAVIYTQAPKMQAALTNRVLFYAKDICDYYVYTLKTLEKDSIYSLSLDELPKDCKIISMSNLTMFAYWPQINPRLDAYNPNYLHSYNSVRDLDFYHILYRRGDLNINRMVREGYPTDEILKRLSDEEFYSEKAVKLNVRTVFRLIQVAERDVDVTILDYVQKNYEERMIYQNFVHPNKCIIWEYVRRLLERLEVDTRETDCLEEQSPEHIHHGGDVPIYPSVIEHLNLDWAKNRQYEVMTGGGIKMMSFREYMEHFIEYERKVLEIMQLW